jgi:hypothetical protein
MSLRVLLQLDQYLQLFHISQAGIICLHSFDSRRHRSFADHPIELFEFLESFQGIN